MRYLGHRIVPVSMAWDDPGDAPWWRCLACEDAWPGLPENPCPKASSDAHQFGTVGAEQGAVSAASPPLSTPVKEAHL